MASAARSVAILIYPGVQSLDVVGPLEVFSGAAQLIGARGGEAPYEVRILAREAGPQMSSSGLELVAQSSIRDAGELDTLIVAGGPGHRRAARDAELLKWVAAHSRLARRTASVCTGAFVLAAAGVLDGRRASTHWAHADALAREYPQIEVDAEPIFIRDGDVWTSAGVTAGMDLALALVEDDLDRETALTIARHLVLFLRRPAGQSQFSAALSAQAPGREPLREAAQAVLERPGGDHSVEAMAARAHMSTRHFSRAFAAATGLTPARYVERVRLEQARRLLEDGREPIEAVAAGSGFTSSETMRRAFERRLGVAPAEYRRRFTTRGART